MKNQRSLGEVLFPKVKRQLLAGFFISPDIQYYGREITRIIEGSHGSVRRELRALVEAGILVREKRGNQQYYWANRDCMIYEELRSIVMKTFGVVDMIRAALFSIRNEIDTAVIFGSIATGTDTARSDIDLLIVGSVNFRKLAVALNDTEQGLGRSINPVLFTLDEFKSKYKNDNHFVHSVIESENLFVWGTQNDLRALAGDRLAKE